MDAPASGRRPPDRDRLEQLVLAALGVVALGGERVEELARELADRGAPRREEARQLADELTQRWRGDAVRAGERAGEGLRGVFDRLGLVTRAELDELELRVAQLEHRLRLVEAQSGEGSPRPRGTA